MGKGEQTREAIVDAAMGMASRVGLAGLSIGGLAEALELSKSGLFAHFRSKEALQVHVLEAASRRFVERVLVPALRAPRGEPRLRALFERWLAWGSSKEMPGGCLFVAAGIELDDRPGPVRDALVRIMKDWHDTLANTARIAVSEGHLRKGLDVGQFAHDLYGIMLAYHHVSRLLRDPKAEERVRSAFEALLQGAR